MCGRYFIEESPELRPIIEAMNHSPLVAKFQKSLAVLSQGEIRPTNVAPVIASSKAGNRAVFPMKWGFTGKTLLINAKTETAAFKPTFREAWASHRCIVPASWYFEWEHMTMNDGKKKTGDKFMLQPKGSPVTWLCGLYRIEEGLPCYVIACFCSSVGSFSCMLNTTLIPTGSLQPGISSFRRQTYSTARECGYFFIHI